MNIEEELTRLQEPDAASEYVVVKREQLMALLAEKRSIVVGNLRITQLDDGTHWIGEAEGGEGGQFKEFVEAVQKFYKENF